MIHYNVTFSFKDGVDHRDGLRRVSAFLDDFSERGLIHAYSVARDGESQFIVQIDFTDREQFGKPFKEVTDAGVCAGLHGFMIDTVGQFAVTIAEDPE